MGDHDGRGLPANGDYCLLHLSYDPIFDPTGQNRAGRDGDSQARCGNALFIDISATQCNGTGWPASSAADGFTPTPPKRRSFRRPPWGDASTLRRYRKTARPAALSLPPAFHPKKRTPKSRHANSLARTFARPPRNTRTGVNGGRTTRSARSTIRGRRISLRRHSSCERAR